jgi:lantibiotic modifying enzyme
VPSRAEYRALGPNLYGGTAGVGLFRAQLGAVTREAAVRRTAVGAFRHAVARAASLPPTRRDGLHAGSVGIAWAAARAAALLADEELHARARAVLADRNLPSRPDRCPVATGAAGAIVGLLALAQPFDDLGLIEDALATGNELLARATIRSFGRSWAIPGRPYPHHLCGVSHGAAGIGWALLELFAATGDERFRAGGAGAFDYERSWLDRRSGTWPDLRIGGQRRGASRTVASPAEGTWCHGEAGIALTRLRATDVLGPGAHECDAELALATTRAHLAAALPYGIEDLSLCHGAAGAADALLCAADAGNKQWHEAAELAAMLGHVALERHETMGHDWPSGVTGTTPGLFLGLSGIAWLFLRLHDHKIESPLTFPSCG